MWLRGANLTHLEAAGHSPLSFAQHLYHPTRFQCQRKGVSGTSSSEEEHGPSCCAGTERGAQLAADREVEPRQGQLPPLHFLILLYNQFFLIHLIVCK